MHKKIAFPVLLTFFYFTIAWGVDWSYFSDFSSISVSYLFDLFFIFSISFVYHIKPNLDFKRIRLFVPRLASTLLLAITSIWIIKVVGMKTPYRYLETPMIQLLILSPIIDEFLYRHAFMALYLDSGLALRYRVWLNAVLYSFSHLPAMWVLPDEYTVFVYFQMFVALILGRILAMGKFKHKSIYGPILLHLNFNLVIAICVSLKIL